MGSLPVSVSVPVRDCGTLWLPRSLAARAGTAAAWHRGRDRDDGDASLRLLAARVPPGPPRPRDSESDSDSLRLASRRRSVAPSLGDSDSELAGDRDAAMWGLRSLRLAPSS